MKKKKVFSYISMLSVMLALAGCASEPTSTTTTTTTEQSSSVQPATTTTVQQ